MPPVGQNPEKGAPVSAGERYLILRRVYIPGYESRRLTDLLLLLSPKAIGREGGEETARILRVAPEIRVESRENGRWSSFDAKGAVIAPAFVDSFCRFGSSEYFYRENPSSGGSAAKAGGFGCLFLFPQTRLNSRSGLSSFRRRMGDIGVMVCPALSLVGGRVQELLALRREFSIEPPLLFSDEGGDQLPDDALLELMKTVAKENGTLFCLGRSSPGGGAVNEGKVAKLMGDPGISPVFERLYVANRLLLSAATGCRIHFPVISEAESITMIREAKRAGIPVTCGTTPLYFSMTDNDLIYRGNACRVDPPLRSERDRMAVIEAIADGTVDCICSGHTPLSPYEKQGDIRRALPGAATLETVFSAGMTYLVESGAIPLERFLHCLTAGPSALIGKRATVAEGESGDLVLLDPDAEVICSDSTMKSRARNTPFLGMALRGRVDALLLGGRFVYRSRGE